MLKQEKSAPSQENSADFPTAQIQIKAKQTTDGNVKWERTAKELLHYLSCYEEEEITDIHFLIYIYLFS